MCSQIFTLPIERSLASFSQQLEEGEFEEYIVNDRLNSDFFQYNKSVARSNSFVNSREVGSLISQVNK